MIGRTLKQFIARESQEEVSSERPPAPAAVRRIWTLTKGAEGGLLATLVMTAFRLPTAGSLPPTADFWAQYVAGGDPEDHTLPALLLHLGYGATAGLVFAVAYSLVGVPDRRDPEPTEANVSGVVLGLCYGLALSVFGTRVVLGRLLGMELDPDEALVFHVGHVVYGLTLGTWLGSRFGGREQYEWGNE